jgi:hypothetical protein
MKSEARYPICPECGGNVISPRAPVCSFCGIGFYGYRYRVDVYPHERCEESHFRKTWQGALSVRDRLTSRGATCAIVNLLPEEN